MKKTEKMKYDPAKMTIAEVINKSVVWLLKDGTAEVNISGVRIAGSLKIYRRRTRSAGEEVDPAEYVREAHRHEIEAALARGVNVKIEVLADYPDLLRSWAEQPAPSPG